MSESILALAIVAVAIVAIVALGTQSSPQRIKATRKLIREVIAFFRHIL